MPSSTNKSVPAAASAASRDTCKRVRLVKDNLGVAAGPGYTCETSYKGIPVNDICTLQGGLDQQIQPSCTITVNLVVVRAAGSRDHQYWSDMLLAARIQSHPLSYIRGSKRGIQQ